MSRSMRRHLRSGRVFAVALIMVLSALPGMAQAGVQDLKGDVTDPRGLPINGARVTDGTGQSTFTGTNGQSTGRYLIEEMALGTYQVSVTKKGFDSSSQSVDPVRALGDVDFTLTYTMSGSVTPNAFRNDPAQLIEIRASSQVPPAGTCVTFTDLSTGGTAPLSYDSLDGRWEGTYQVPASIVDGTYSWTLRATDCSSGMVLSSTYSSTYVVDTLPPVIDRASFLPSEGGNAAFPAVSLAVRIWDLPAGISLESSVLMIERTGESRTVPATSYDPVTGWLRSGLVPIQKGASYRVGVTASDFAGNTRIAWQSPVETSGGFLATGLALGSANARINEVVCSLSSVDIASRSKTITCPNVILTIDASSALVEGTSHAGVGFAAHTVSIDSAQLVGTVLGATEVSEKAYPGQSKNQQLRFDVTSASGDDQTVPVQGGSVPLGTFTRQVDPAWTSARLFMPQVASTVTTTACAQPDVNTGAMISCVSDPLENDYIVALDDGSDPEQVAQAHATGYGIDPLGIEADYPAYRAIISPSQAGRIASDSTSGGNSIEYITRSLVWNLNDDVVCSGGSMHAGSIAYWMLRYHRDHLAAADAESRAVLETVFEDSACSVKLNARGLPTSTQGTKANQNVPGSYGEDSYGICPSWDYCITGMSMYRVRWGLGTWSTTSNVYLSWDTNVGQNPPGPKYCSVWADQSGSYRDDYQGWPVSFPDGCAGSGDGDYQSFSDRSSASGRIDWLTTDPSKTAATLSGDQIHTAYKAKGTVRNKDGSLTSEWACFFTDYQAATASPIAGGFCTNP